MQDKVELVVFVIGIVTATAIVYLLMSPKFIFRKANRRIYDMAVHSRAQTAVSYTQEEMMEAIVSVSEEAARSGKFETRELKALYMDGYKVYDIKTMKRLLSKESMKTLLEDQGILVSFGYKKVKMPEPVLVPYIFLRWG